MNENSLAIYPGITARETAKSLSMASVLFNLIKGEQYETRNTAIEIAGHLSDMLRKEELAKKGE